MHALHLVGATTTRFYLELSQTYHAACTAPAGVRASVLTVRPDRSMTWRDGDGPDEPVTLGDVTLRAGAVDLVVPHMFCPVGMTTWRAFFEDMLGVPVVGPCAAAIATATSKWRTKALAAAEGVATPQAVRLTGPAPCPPLPAIVKPDDEDNSIGLSLVRERTAWTAALGRALAAGSGEALAEAYVPGREVRVAVLADPVARVLPVMEYHVTPDHPIRVGTDKVATDAAGTVTTASWDRPSLATSCPADLSDASAAALSRAALRMHGALRCRDYSLFDFRIHAETGAPWLLEACVFWSFSRFSVISRMLEAEGTALDAVAGRMWARAAARRGMAQAAE